MFCILLSFLILRVVKAPTDSFEVIEQLFKREQWKEALVGYQTLVKFKDIAPEALFRIAECYYNLQEYTKAIEAFERVIKLYPKSYIAPEALYGIGMCWLAIGNVEKAKEYLIKKIDDFPGYREEKRTLSGKGIVLYAEGKYTDALIYLEPLDTKEALYYRAKCYSKLGDPLKAIEIYKRIIEEFPKTKFAEYSAFGMGMALFENKDFPAASKKLEEFLLKYPWSPLKDYARYFLGCCYLYMKENEKCIEQKGLVIKTVKTEDPWLLAHSWYQLGTARYNLERPEESILALQKVKLDYPDMRVAALSHIRHGQCYVQKGDTVGAQLAFQQVIARYPTGNFAGLGNYLTATAFLIQKRYTEALEHYQEVIRKFPASEVLLPSYVMMLYCYLKLNKHEEGAALGTSVIRLLKDYPKDEMWVGRAKLYLGELYYYLGRYEKAKDFYEEVANDFMFPELRAPATIGKAWCLIAQDRTEEAGKMLEEAFRKWGAKDTLLAISSLYGWGISSFNKGNFEDAYGVFVVGLGENYPDEMEITGNAYYYGGKALAAQGLYGNAIDFWKKVIDEYPTCSKAPDAAFDLGRIYFMAGKYNEALDAYNIILEEHSKHPLAKEAQFQIAATYFQQRMYEDAIREYEKFIELYPTDAEVEAAKNQIATSLYIWGEEYPEAHRELVEKYPGSELAAEAQYVLAAKAYNDNRFEEAITEFRKLLVTFPKSEKATDAQYFLIACYRELGKDEESIEACKKFIEYFPKEKRVPDVYYQLGVMYYNKGNFVDAISAFKTIVEKYQDYEKYNKAGYYLGLAYQNVGEKDKAERLLKKFKEEKTGG